MITVALRDAEGNKHVFDVEPGDAANHDEAVSLARQHFPNAQVILATVSHG